VDFQAKALYSSFGANEGGSAQGQMGTLGGGSNDNFRFSFSAIDTPTSRPVLTFATLKHASPTDTMQAGKIGLILSIDQGQANPMRYVRVITVGPDFQWNIGRSEIVMNDLAERARSI
jgi:hypothetical protein